MSGLLLIPAAPRAVLQFNGGTAAKKEFYLRFLEYFCANGYLCCLWDYRGSGDSAPTDLARCDYRFSDYGTKDMPAIKAYLLETFPDLPLLLFAHSAGGQQIGLMPDLNGYQGMVAFAVSTGYLPHMPLGYRLTSRYFFNVFTPLSILFSGYVRSKPFGYMENLPKQVVLEWRDWCAKREYLFDRKFMGKTIPMGNYQDIPFPIHVYWATDDPISNIKSVPTFWEKVTSTQQISIESISPKSVHQKKLGHFGFFKKQMESTLWARALEKLDALIL